MVAAFRSSSRWVAAEVDGAVADLAAVAEDLVDLVEGEDSPVVGEGRHGERRV